MLKKLFIFLFLLFLIIGGAVAYLYQQNFMASNVLEIQGKEKSSFSIFIPKGANTDDVYQLLNGSERLMGKGQLRVLMDIKNFKGNLIVPGRYKIGEGWSNNQIIDHLRAGNGREDSRMQFNNVQTIEDLAGKMTKELLLDSMGMLNYMKEQQPWVNYGLKEETFLTMFIPNTYFVDVDAQPEELMQRMADEYKKFWGAKDRSNKAVKIGMSRSEVVTLASIVYWETKLKEDMPKVAGVYMNRIKNGWPLQADPTLVYIMKKRGVQVKRVLNKHKKLDSPYNTYKYKGLPPGPILIPPAVYIDAVLNYEKHGYFFFVAKEDFSGRSYFSKTLAQHNIYAKRYQRALNKRKIYR